MAAIIFAGEMIFTLPFHVARFFRPTLLEVFQISNTELGDIFAVYGIIAMLAYFPGGMIADRFSARKLMAFSLFCTSLGGFYYYTLPSATGLTWLFGYWGLTSILLFWAAMIKATRECMTANTQGLGFGLLDGGRGLVASVFASIAVFILALFMNEQVVNIEQQKLALQSVILFYSISTMLAAGLIWILLPNTEITIDNKSTSHGELKSVLSNRGIWLQGGIVVAAYCGYKSIDNYGLYAVQVLGMSALESAEFTTYASYTRPFAAITAGLLVDRWRVSSMLMTLFTVCIIAFLSLAVISASQIALQLIMVNLVITFIAVFALRGIYFALLEESKLKLNKTGTAVGLISLLGFTPDIFFYALSGRVLDANPGLIGFQNYFMLIALISIIGLLCSFFLSKHIKRQEVKLVTYQEQAKSRSLMGNDST
ncbi:nitrate/nitrite transporter [Colwelliaceae bacterium BS250]